MTISGAGRFFVCVVVASSFLVGCQRAQNEKQASSLEESHKMFGKLLRWQEYEAASRYIVVRESQVQPLDLESLDEIRVTSYEVVDKLIIQDKNEAVITVKIEFYQDDTARVYSLRDEQNWWYSQEQERWFLDDTLPDFRDAMRPAKR